MKLKDLLTIGMLLIAGSAIVGAWQAGPWQQDEVDYGIIFNENVTVDDTLKVDLVAADDSSEVEFLDVTVFNTVVVVIDSTQKLVTDSVFAYSGTRVIFADTTQFDQPIQVSTHRAVGNITLDPVGAGATYVNISNSGAGAAKLYVEGDQVNSDDLSDVASIAMLDENETVSGRYTFSDLTTFNDTLQVRNILFDAATYNIGDATNYVATLFVHIIDGGTANLVALAAGDTLQTPDNGGILLGTGQDYAIEMDTGQTKDALIIGVDDASTDKSRTIIICDKGDMGTDFGMPTQTDPTIYLVNAAGTKGLLLRNDANSAYVSGYGAHLYLQAGGGAGIYIDPQNGGTIIAKLSQSNERILTGLGEQAQIALGANLDQDDILIQRDVDGGGSWSEAGALLTLQRDVTNVTAENGNFLEMQNAAGTVLLAIDKNGAFVPGSGLDVCLDVDATGEEVRLGDTGDANQYTSFDQYGSPTWALHTIAAGDSVFLKTFVDAADTTLKIWNGSAWITIQDLTP